MNLIFVNLRRCYEDDRPACRFKDLPHLTAYLEEYRTHEFHCYDITDSVDKQFLKGRTKKLEVGVLGNMEERLRHASIFMSIHLSSIHLSTHIYTYVHRNIIEDGIRNRVIDLEAKPQFSSDGEREYTRQAVNSQKLVQIHVKFV